MNQDFPKEKLTINIQMQLLAKLLARGKSVLGIDIGISSINVAQSVIYKGKVTIIKVVVENIGNVSDEEREQATVEALKRALADFNVDRADVVCTMANHKTIVDYVIMPLMPDSEISEAVRLEVSGSEHFPVENPIIDFKVVGPTLDKDVQRVNVMVAAVAQSSVDSLLSYFKPKANDFLVALKKMLLVDDFMGLNLMKITPVSIALENVIGQSKIQETIAIIEIGTMFGELNIYCNGHLELSRKINVTGLDLTRSLTSALSTSSGKTELTLEEAEWVKKEFGIPKAGEEFLIKDKITANQVISLLRPKLEQLIREITRSFDFYYDRKRAGKIDQLVLFGGGALLRRLPEFLNAELELPVVIGNPIADVNLLYPELVDQTQDIQRITLSIGAALADTRGINLLPVKFRDSRKNLIQKLIIGAVGTGLVLISLICYLSLGLELHHIKQDSEKTRDVYLKLIPQLKTIKDKFLIESLAYNRFDIVGLLKELSYTSDKVFFTELRLRNGEFVLTGFISADARESRKKVLALIGQLKKSSLQNVKILEVKEVSSENPTSQFKITADLIKSRSGS